MTLYCTTVLRELQHRVQLPKAPQSKTFSQPGTLRPLQEPSKPHAAV